MARTESDKGNKNTGNLIDEYMQGSVKVRIFNDYTIKSDSEKIKFDERMRRICWDIVSAARAAGKDI